MTKKKKFYLISEASAMTGVPRSTLYYLDKKRFIIPERRLNPTSKMSDRFYSEDQIRKIKFLQLLENKAGLEFCYNVLKESLEKEERYRNKFDRLIKIMKE